MKNVSDKPIYFMLVYLVFADEKIANGEAAISLMYGDPKKNGNIANYANAEDERLAPGETYVFTVPEVDKKGLKAKHTKFPERTRNLELEFAIINFGDRTGFEGGQSLDLRGKASNLSPPKKLPFKNVKLSHSTTTSIPVQDGCGGGNCFRWYIDPEPVPSSCACSLTRVATTSPDRPCKRLKHIFLTVTVTVNLENAITTLLTMRDQPLAQVRHLHPHRHHLRQTATVFQNPTRIALANIPLSMAHHTGFAIIALAAWMRIRPDTRRPAVPATWLTVEIIAVCAQIRVPVTKAITGIRRAVSAFRNRGNPAIVILSPPGIAPSPAAR